jgi:hypothetical protein
VADSLHVVSVKLDQIAQKQEKTDEKLSLLNERVLNPESGLFAKVKINDMQMTSNREDIDELHESIDKLLSVCQSHEKSVSAMERWMADHELRDNELRDSVSKMADSIAKKFEQQDETLQPIKDDYIIRKSNKIWKDGIFWIVVAGLVTSLVLPPIFKLFKGDYQEKQKIENKVK